MKLGIQVDGASHGNPGPAAIGVVVKDTNGKLLCLISQSIGHATNNQAEYRALIAGLRKGLELGMTEADVHLDSELALRQLTGLYRVKSPTIVPLFLEASSLLKMVRVTFHQTSHTGNAEAHHQAQAALKQGHQ
jgi:ribonuclease HI